MPIDNSTIPLGTLVMENLSYIIPIVAAIISFVLGYLVNRHLQKTNNIREKAREIRIAFEDKIKPVVSHELNKIQESNYLFVQYRQVTNSLEIKFHLQNQAIITELVNSKLFKLDESGRLTLRYNSNRQFNHYGKEIIKLVEKNSQKIETMNALVKKVTDRSSSVPEFNPSEFRHAILQLNLSTRLQGFANGIQDNGLFLIYICSLFRSHNSYRNGDTSIIELLQQKNDELKQIVASDEKSKELYNEIQVVRSDLEQEFHTLDNTISSLCEDFQNRYNI